MQLFLIVDTIIIFSLVSYIFSFWEMVAVDSHEIR